MVTSTKWPESGVFSHVLSMTHYEHHMVIDVCETADQPRITTVVHQCHLRLFGHIPRFPDSNSALWMDYSCSWLVKISRLHHIIWWHNKVRKVKFSHVCSINLELTTDDCSRCFYFNEQFQWTFESWTVSQSLWNWLSAYVTVIC